MKEGEKKRKKAENRFSNDSDTKKLTRKRGPKDRFVGRHFQGSRPLTLFLEICTPPEIHLGRSLSLAAICRGSLVEL